MELLICFLGSVLFTLAISFGQGKELTETPYGRPILGALGFLIVIGGYSWEQQNIALFRDLVFWFVICCFPVMVGGALTGIMDARKEVERHKRLDLARLDPSRTNEHAQT